MNLDLNDVLYPSNPGDRLDDLCRDHGRRFRRSWTDQRHLALRLRSASLDMVVPVTRRC